MSKDRDGQQRLWKSRGYGGKRAPKTSWRDWPKQDVDREWVIKAPNGLAQFEQKDETIFFKGEKIITAKTQWQATWAALAYFYEHAGRTLAPPCLWREVTRNE